jgi:hypothetical protein
MFGSSGDEEEMRLAMLMSEESFAMEESRNSSGVDTPREDEPGSVAARSPRLMEDDEVAEAIRRSLLEANLHSETSSPTGGSLYKVASPSAEKSDLDRDLEMALLLSLQEQDRSDSFSEDTSGLETDPDEGQDEFPSLMSSGDVSSSGSVNVKGKGRSIW